MRQVGLLAAAGAHALENNVGRLRDDHENAARFARLFRGCRGLRVDHDDNYSTDLLYIRCDKNAADPLQFLDRLKRVHNMIEQGCRYCSNLP